MGDLRKQSGCSKRLSGVFCILTFCPVSALPPHFSPLLPQARFLLCNPIILFSHQPLHGFFFFFSSWLFHFFLQPLNVGAPTHPCKALFFLLFPRDLILSARLNSLLIHTNTIYQQRTCILYFWL